MDAGKVLDSLVELQKVDSEIQDLNREIEDIKAKITVQNDKIAANREEFSEKKKKLDEFRKARIELDVDIKSKEADIKTKDGQTSNVTTNEAYKALQAEIDGLKEGIRKLEDKSLELMEEEDKLHSWVKEQEVAMKKKEELINGEIKKFEREIKEVEGKMEGIKAGRDSKAKGVEKIWLERYERIRDNKGGLAIAELITDAKGNGMCGGCKMSIHAQAVIEVRKRTEIKTCDNCARIWYVTGRESGK